MVFMYKTRFYCNKDDCVHVFVDYNNQSSMSDESQLQLYLIKPGKLTCKSHFSKRSLFNPGAINEFRKFLLPPPKDSLVASR